MKPLLWTFGAGAVAIGGILLLNNRQARAATIAPPPQPEPPPPRTFGEATQVTLAVPSGWRRVSAAEASALPELVVEANALRNTAGFTSMPYGTLNAFTASDGKTYATWIEQHWHAPGGPVTPWGLHHGVTLLAQV